MVQAVIFDMDGVLIRSEQFYYERRMRFFDEIKVEPATRDFQLFIGASGKKIWELLVPDSSRRQQLLYEYNQFRLSNEIDYREYLIPEVPETLRAIKALGLVVGLASAGEMKEIKRMLCECEIESYFDQVVSGETVSHNKPNPAVYLQTLKQLGLDSSDCLAVEDSANGITAANAAGLKTLALKPQGYHLNQTAAAKIINRFSDLISEVRK